MTACNCVTPSPFCPCQRHVFPLTWQPYPQHVWLYPKTWNPSITVTTKTTFLPAPKPDIPAMRAEDV